MSGTDVTLDWSGRDCRGRRLGILDAVGIYLRCCGFYHLIGRQLCSMDPTSQQAGRYVPWILLPNRQAERFRGSYIYPMGRRIATIDGSYYPMGRQIGTVNPTTQWAGGQVPCVDPTTQWAGLCLRNGMHQRWTFRNNYVGHHPLWDIISWILSTFRSFSSGTFYHVQVWCQDVLQPHQQLYCLYSICPSPPPHLVKHRVWKYAGEKNSKT